MFFVSIFLFNKLLITLELLTIYVKIVTIIIELKTYTKPKVITVINAKNSFNLNLLLSSLVADSRKYIREIIIKNE